MAVIGLNAVIRIAITLSQWVIVVCIRERTERACREIRNRAEEMSCRYTTTQG